MVNLDPSDGLAAFRTGSVDALSNDPSRHTALTGTGFARILLTNTDVGFPSSTATVVRTADLKDPAKVAAFRDFVVRIQQWNDWKATHEKQVEQILVNAVHLRPEDAAYDAHADVSDVDIVDAKFFATEQHIADVLAASGGIPKHVDVKLEYDTRFNADLAKARRIPYAAP